MCAVQAAMALRAMALLTALHHRRAHGPPAVATAEWTDPLYQRDESAVDDQAHSAGGLPACACLAF